MQDNALELLQSLVQAKNAAAGKRTIVVDTIAEMEALFDNLETLGDENVSIMCRELDFSFNDSIKKPRKLPKTDKKCKKKRSDLSGNQGIKASKYKN